MNCNGTKKECPFLCRKSINHSHNIFLRLNAKSSRGVCEKSQIIGRLYYNSPIDNGGAAFDTDM